MSRPLISIVVPTKDRYTYLVQLIQLIESFNSDKIELIVQDNTYDNSYMIDYLSNNNFSRLKYYHTKEQLSVSDNSTKAILNSRGEYGCFIGDDDGVLPSIIGVAQHMKDNGVDSLLSSPLIYNWPDYADTSIYNLSSAVLYKKGSGKYNVLNAQDEIKRCLKSGIRDLCKLPKVYQGIVRRSFLDKVFEKTGTFFPGPSPDMANAFALALLNPHMMYLDEPLIISGQCRTVGGGERLLKRNNLPKITEIAALPKDIDETWDNRLPKYWCADTIWPQSAISAYKAMNIALPEINFNHIMAIFIFDHPSYFKECKPFITNYFSFIFYFIRCFFDKGFRFVFWRMSFYLNSKKKRAGTYIERNCRSIKEAVSFLMSIRTNRK